MGKTFACMNVAVIGNCKKTSIVAEKLAEAGHSVLIGLKEGEDDDILVSTEYDNIYFENIENACWEADVIFMMMPAERVREIAYLMGDVRKKVIVDLSGNIDPKPEEYIYTLKATRSITGAQHIVKAYYLSPVFEKDGDDIFFAGDCKKAKATARILANDMGFANTHDFGGPEALPVLDEMMRFWHNVASKQEGKGFGFKIVMR